MISIPIQNLYQKSFKDTQVSLSLDDLIDNIKNENYKELENTPYIKTAIKQILQREPQAKLANLSNLIDKKLISSSDKNGLETLKDIKNIIENELKNPQKNMIVSSKIKSILKDINIIIKDTKKGSFPKKNELVKSLNEAKQEIENLSKKLEEVVLKQTQIQSEDSKPTTTYQTHKKRLAQNEAMIKKEFSLKEQTKQNNIDQKIVDQKATKLHQNIHQAKLIKEELPKVTIALKRGIQTANEQIIQATKKQQDNIKMIKQKLTSTLTKLQSITEDIIDKPTKNISTSIVQTLKEHIKSNQTHRLNLATKQHISKIVDNVTKQVKQIQNLIRDDVLTKDIAKNLENFTKDIDQINLKKNIQNSGLFLETKLKADDLSNQSIDGDLKATLYKLKDISSHAQNIHLHKLIDKTIADIQTFQLNSIISSNITMYIPFEWDSLKDGTMSFYSSKDQKKFSCKIDLDLEKYGKIDIMMIADHSSNISINFNIEDEHFRQILKKNIDKLKMGLRKNKVNANIFFTRQQKNCYTQDELLEMGMDFKV